MAKKATETTTKTRGKKAPATKKKGTFPPKRDTEEFPYGVKEAAKALGISEQAARVKFRKQEVAKEGSTYAWRTQKAMDSAIKSCRAD